MAQWVKNSPATARGLGSIPGSGKSPGGGNGYALQYACLENPMDRRTWWATVHGITKESCDDLATKQPPFSHKKEGNPIICNNMVGP